MRGLVCTRFRQRGSTLAGVLVGLLIGVVIAVAVALYINFGPKPFLKKQAESASAPAETPLSASAPVTLPGKPGDTPVEKPHYDFYKILPGGDSASMPATDAAKPQKPAPSNKVYLQAGAFQDPSEADNLKARLSLMGMEAGVQQIDIPGKGTFHRVRIGPFDNQQDADAAHARLAQEGIESAIVRSNPAASGSASGASAKP